MLQAQRIASGSAIAADPTVYAKLYKRTGLSELDPRIIPPRHNRLPNRQIVFTERAWTEKQFSEWLARSANVSAEIHRSHKAKRPKSIEEGEIEDRARPISPTSQQKANPTPALYGVVPGLLDELLVQIVNQIQQPLLEQLEAIRRKIDDIDSGQIPTKVLAVEQEVLSVNQLLEQSP